ncbi:Chitinase 2 [Marasmius crinis-equi]|uniref:Chitinase 2 n=1 Tax=Marasmius crinis-equi TaxID=585013 RepID=A0ABR3EUP3_9AGAR
MDNFMNLAKKGLDAYDSHSNSGSNVSKTGGAEFNPENRTSSHGPSFNDDEVVRSAEQHGSGDSSLFKTALGFISENKESHQQPVNEEHATRAHQQAYQENNASNMDAHSLGSAAALQALKQFTGGGSSTQSSSGGGSQTQLISLAMAEASKLFDKSGGGASGNKQDAVNGAAMTVMKLLVQSKFGGGAQTTGGKDSGGLGSLMSLASQFTK